MADEASKAFTTGGDDIMIKPQKNILHLIKTKIVTQF
jgi:hypothetical protein